MRRLEKTLTHAFTAQAWQRFAVKLCVLSFLLLSSPHDDCFGEGNALIPALNIDDHRLPEVSGIDLAHRADLWLWAINDSGNGPWLSGLDHGGKLVEHLELPLVNIDWEDLSTFEWNKESWILIGDVGDNRGKRGFVKLYLFKEPQKGKVVEVDQIHTFILRYENGPRDVESIAVDSEKGWVYLLSKRDPSPFLYRFPLDLSLAEENLILTPVAQFDHLPQPTKLDLKFKYGSHVSYPTAMDFDAQHRRLAILTYKHAYVFSCLGDDPSQWVKTFSTIELPSQSVLKQRESLCWNQGGDGMVVISEGSRSPVVQVSAPWN